MPVRSSERGSSSAPGKGATWACRVAPGASDPFSSMRRGMAAISSSAWRLQSKPPVSTSTTTGRKPRKRVAMVEAKMALRSDGAVIGKV